MVSAHNTLAAFSESLGSDIIGSHCRKQGQDLREQYGSGSGEHPRAGGVPQQGLSHGCCVVCVCVQPLHKIRCALLNGSGMYEKMEAKD